MLKSLSGLRLGFYYTESTLDDAANCLGLDGAVNFCQNAAHSDVRLNV